MSPTVGTFQNMKTHFLSCPPSCDVIVDKSRTILRVEQLVKMWQALKQGVGKQRQVHHAMVGEEECPELTSAWGSLHHCMALSHPRVRVS